jgi:hypothetical protein
MLNELESLVTRLHECLVSTTQYSDESRSIVTDIIYTCGENMNVQTISMLPILPHFMPHIQLEYFQTTTFSHLPLDIFQTRQEPAHLHSTCYQPRRTSHLQARNSPIPTQVYLRRGQADRALRLRHQGRLCGRLQLREVLRRPLRHFPSDGQALGDHKRQQRDSQPHEPAQTNRGVLHLTGEHLQALIFAQGQYPGHAGPCLQIPPPRNSHLL